MPISMVVSLLRQRHKIVIAGAQQYGTALAFYLQQESVLPIKAMDCLDAWLPVKLNFQLSENKQRLI